MPSNGKLIPTSLRLQLLSVLLSLPSQLSSLIIVRSVSKEILTLASPGC
uniref:Uncharacterized protein n=1 Tax=Phakopsora pachyrhizi TaxID=170000 RepID=A0A0S1MJC0_PHAPC